MPGKNLIWKICPPYLLIILVSLSVLACLATVAVRDFYDELMRKKLEHVSSVVELYTENLVSDTGSNRELQTFCKQIGEKTSIRVTIVSLDGTVLADSHEEPAKMENHNSRPELVKAFIGEIGESTRYSSTLRRRMKYVAVPLNRQGEVIGAVRSSKAVTLIEEALRSIYSSIILGGAVVLVVAVILSFWLAKNITAPLQELRGVAERLARGEFTARMSPPEATELAQLADAMNSMADQLHTRIETIVQQRNELDATLSSMTEGVVAIDPEENVISVNKAATFMLKCNPSLVFGKSLLEAVRNPELHEIAGRALNENSTTEGEVMLLIDNEETFIQVHGAPMKNQDGENIGAVIVMNDVTRLKRLENMRRDFAANVSHELKTPITSIKGFVETLLDGAKNDPEDCEHFLNIILNQTDRLDALIQDLLMLSRIENQSDTKVLDLQSKPLTDLLEEAVFSRRKKADKKMISLTLECPEDLEVEVNPLLLEQAVGNLVDNAINYSNNGTDVEVLVEASQTDISIHVKDKGVGIAPEHLDRLFERFYRVDRARSRDQGGTGLGLAIVKHVVQLHNGEVSATSCPHKGSTFTVRIPRIQNL